VKEGQILYINLHKTLMLSYHACGEGHGKNNAIKNGEKGWGGLAALDCASKDIKS